MTLHPSVKAELDNLQLQFPKQAQINLDQYAELYKIGRRYAPQHLRRKGIAYSKEGKSVYVNILDLAIYKARCKSGKEPLITKVDAVEMKRRRGFSRMAEERQLHGQGGK